MLTSNLTYHLTEYFGHWLSMECLDAEKYLVHSKVVCRSMKHFRYSLTVTHVYYLAALFHWYREEPNQISHTLVFDRLPFQSLLLHPWVSIHSQRTLCVRSWRTGQLPPLYIHHPSFATSVPPQFGCFFFFLIGTSRPGVDSQVWMAIQVQRFTYI